MIDSIADGGAPAPDLKRPRRQKTSSATPKLDRLPPHSPEAEQGVLGCILLAPNDCMGECIEKLKSSDEVFYDLRHQTIFKTLTEIYESRAPIELITLQQQLKNAQVLEQVGGLPFLSVLPDAVPSAGTLSISLEI